MDDLSDSFDEVLVAVSQQQEQLRERTQAEIEEEQRRQALEREMDELYEESVALREWGERCSLLMNKRRQIERAFWDGMPKNINYYQTPSPIDDPTPGTPTAPLNRAMRATFEEFFPEDSSRSMAPAETEDEVDVELRLDRSPWRRSPSSGISPRTLVPPVEPASDDESDVDWEDVPGLGARRLPTVVGDGVERAGSDASLGSVGTMVFPMEMEDEDEDDAEDDGPNEMRRGDFPSG